VRCGLKGLEGGGTKGQDKSSCYRLAVADRIEPKVTASLTCSRSGPGWMQNEILRNLRARTT
jgi:hypothetical protein